MMDDWWLMTHDSMMDDSMTHSMTHATMELEHWFDLILNWFEFIFNTSQVNRVGMSCHISLSLSLSEGVWVWVKSQITSNPVFCLPLSPWLMLQDVEQQLPNGRVAMQHKQQFENGCVAAPPDTGPASGNGAQSTQVSVKTEFWTTGWGGLFSHFVVPCKHHCLHLWPWWKMISTGQE